MTITGPALDIYFGVLYFAWVGSLIFPIVYGFTRPWRKSPVGRLLVADSAVIALALTLVVIRPIFGDFPGRQVLNYFIIVALAFVIWWRVILFFRIGKADKHKE